MQSPVILIPPSEGKTLDGSGAPLKKAPPLSAPMIERLRAYDGDPGKLLGVKGKALEAAVDANARVLKSPTLPAIERYSGVVYQGIDYASLNAATRKWFDNHVRIVSALFGLVAPGDLIPDYKLKIEKLDAAKYWKPLVAAELKKAYVIDLLPQAHKKAVAFEQGVSPDFIVIKNGKRKPAGHHGKLIKGRFVRWLCENRVKNAEAFGDFAEDGFAWDGENFIKK